MLKENSEKTLSFSMKLKKTKKKVAKVEMEEFDDIFSVEEKKQDLPLLTFDSGKEKDPKNENKEEEDELEAFMSGLEQQQKQEDEEKKNYEASLSILLLLLQ